MCSGCDILIALLLCSGEFAAKSFLVPKAFALIAYYWNDQYLINELLIVLLHTGMLMIIYTANPSLQFDGCVEGKAEDRDRYSEDGV